MNENTIFQHGEHQARRAAKRAGLKARKSRWRALTVILTDAVVAFCAEYASGGHQRQAGDPNESVAGT
jgi:anti-sigma-K factor RskA